MGAQRAGTTWWHRLLAAHPDVLPAPRKELHFFEAFHGRGLSTGDVERYHALFPRPPGRVTGEWTPRYMLDVWTPRLLKQAAPDAKLLVMLRDPVERYRSGLAQAEASAAARGALVPPTAWADALARSQYAAQLHRLLQHFPRERTLVLQYESCCAKPLEELRRTCAFLGLEPPGRLPAGLDPRPSPAGGPNGLATDLRADVVGALRPDVDALHVGWPEVDVGLWPDFAPKAGGFARRAPGSASRIGSPDA